MRSRARLPAEHLDHTLSFHGTTRSQERCCQAGPQLLLSHWGPASLPIHRDTGPTNPTQRTRGPLGICAQARFSSVHTEGLQESSGHLRWSVSLTDPMVMYLITRYRDTSTKVYRDRREMVPILQITTLRGGSVLSQDTPLNSERGLHSSPSPARQVMSHAGASVSLPVV